MTPKTPNSIGFHGIIKTAPKSACNTRRGLTLSSGTSREGLPVMVPKTCSIEDCDAPRVRKNGMCDSHYRKWVRSTPPELRNKMTDLERFWACVSKTEDCWTWNGAINPYGYGTFTVSRTPKLAHRYLFESIHGHLPASIQVDHMCHNRACVNPEHLRPATNKQNQENRKSAQRNNRSSGIRGVSWNKNLGKWQAYVGHNGKRIHIGYYDDMTEAGEQALQRRLEIYTHNAADIRKVWAETTPGIDITITEIGAA